MNRGQVLNFIAMMVYGRINNLLVSHKMLRKHSPVDVPEHLSRVQMLRMEDQWIVTEIPKRTRDYSTARDTYCSKSTELQINQK